MPRYRVTFEVETVDPVPLDAFNAEDWLSLMMDQHGYAEVDDYLVNEVTGEVATWDNKVEVSDG